jgi:tetratricopeptide (TPR) repeat protein
MNANASQWRNRAGMMMEVEAFDSAYRDYSTALELDPTDGPALDGFVRAATAARREDDAERRLRAIIQARTAEAGPRVALAELLGIRGRFDEAVAVASEATQIEPGAPAAWEQLASLHTDRGDVVRLAPAVKVLSSDFPSRAASWYFAASESFLRGDVAGALPLVRRAIQLDPNYADAYNLLGAIHGTAGDTNTSREAFRTSLRLDPRDAITYINLAQLEMAAGQRDAAADLFAEALSLDPNSMAAREGLMQMRRVP